MTVQCNPVVLSQSPPGANEEHLREISVELLSALVSEL